MTIDVLNAIAQHPRNSARRFTPAFPWIFIRVLKREQKIGHIIAPDHEQNKTVHEGIVLATWRKSPALFYNVNSSQWEAPQMFISELVPGDHVLFPHFAGMPIQGYDASLYRVVKEANWAMDKEGGIIGVVEHETPDTDYLEEIICPYITSPGDRKLLLLDIMERFLLVDRERQSATLSGV